MENHLCFSASDDYRKVLQAMATRLDGWVQKSEIKQIAGLKESTVTNALQALTTRNIILSNSAKRGEYRLPTKSFAVWIKAAASVPVKV